MVSRHISNILKDGELDEKVVCAKFAHTTQHGAISTKSQTRTLSYYNLDIILSVGYRTKSARAIRFRQWANNILKQHITKGFTITPYIIEKNKSQFLKTIEDLKLLSKSTSNLDATDVLSLIQNFSHTWFSLESYDKGNFPSGGTKEELDLSASDLLEDLQKLKENLIRSSQATTLFGEEKRKGTMEGILGSVFQSVFGQDAYPSIEEKAKGQSQYPLIFMLY